MAIFHFLQARLMRGLLIIIIISSLATAFGVEALQELVYDPIKYPDYTTFEPFEAGTVVKIPGLITAFSAYSWKDADVGFAYSFLNSKSNLTAAYLQVHTFQGNRNVFFCSIGINMGFYAQAGSTTFELGVPPYIWRAPCDPAKIPLRGKNASCAVVLTPAGDLQLLDVIANKIIWRSDTNGVGQTKMRMDDNSSLSLITVADETTVWQSQTDYITGYDSRCRTFSGSGGKAKPGFTVLEFPGCGCCCILIFLTAAVVTLLIAP